MNINERVILLKELQVISRNNYEALNSIINLIENSFSIDLSKENGEMFITHLSAVFSRDEKGEEINSLDESLLEEIYTNEYYNKAEAILKDIKEKVNYKIKKAEDSFIILHLCTLLGTVK